MENIHPRVVAPNPNKHVLKLTGAEYTYLYAYSAPVSFCSFGYWDIWGQFPLIQFIDIIATRSYTINYAA